MPGDSSVWLAQSKEGSRAQGREWRRYKKVVMLHLVEIFLHGNLHPISSTLFLNSLSVDCSWARVVQDGHLEGFKEGRRILITCKIHFETSDSIEEGYYMSPRGGECQDRGKTFSQGCPHFQGCYTQRRPLLWQATALYLRFGRF